MPNAFSMRNRRRDVMSPINHARMKSEIYESRIKIPYSGRRARWTDATAPRGTRRCTRKISVTLISRNATSGYYFERFKKKKKNRERERDRNYATTMHILFLLQHTQDGISFLVELKSSGVKHQSFENNDD